MFTIEPVDGRIVFIDTETTALSKQLRRVWEIGAIIRDPDQPDVEVEWQLRPDVTEADPDALRIGRYYRRNRALHLPVGSGMTIVGPGLEELERQTDDADTRRVATADEIAATLAKILDGAYIVGAVPSFDELSLDIFLRESNQALTSHYRLKDVETLTLGYLNGRYAERATSPGYADLATLRSQIPPPPWDPKLLSELIGVQPPPPELRHRALVDARWTRDVFDVVTGYEHKPADTAV